MEIVHIVDLLESGHIQKDVLSHSQRLMLLTYRDKELLSSLL